MKQLLSIFQWLLRLLTPGSDEKTVEIGVNRSLAWGNKVSAGFREKVFEVASALQVEPDELMAVMAFETAETFRPDIKNMAGSGATGLIQFMPSTARGLGTSTEALARMSAIEQLEWVRTYFKPYTGRLTSLSDLYMAVLWPRAIGKPDNYVLWSKATKPTTYAQNAGLDANKDGFITKAEAASKVYEKLRKGRTDKYLWVEP